MFKFSAMTRLVHWREFRKNLDKLSFEQALAETADLWGPCPFSPYYLDASKPNEWPDPWKLIEENYYCDIAKALGIIYTVAFTVHKPKVELRMYVDPETKYSYNLAWFDEGKYILNLIDGEVVNNLQSVEHLELKRTFNQELNLNNY